MGPGRIGLVSDPLSAGLADVAPSLDNRKRPFSSTPLFYVCPILRKNKIPSSRTHQSNLEKDALLPSLRNRIEEFFDFPPCSHSGDLLWTAPHDPANEVYSDSSPPPYIVLMESTSPGKNLVKYDRLQRTLAART